MGDAMNEGKKTELLQRIDHLHDLVAGDEPEAAIRAAYAEVGRSLDGLTRPGRADGGMQIPAGSGEPPPAL